MSDGMVNKLIIWLARKLNCSPILAHCVIMSFVSLGYGVLNPDGLRVLGDPVFLVIWVPFCIIVVLVTWLTKGELRKAWTQAEPWK